MKIDHIFIKEASAKHSLVGSQPAAVKRAMWGLTLTLTDIAGRIPLLHVFTHSIQTDSVEFDRNHNHVCILRHTNNTRTLNTIAIPYSSTNSARYTTGNDTNKKNTDRGSCRTKVPVHVMSSSYEYRHILNVYTQHSDGCTGDHYRFYPLWRVS